LVGFGGEAAKTNQKNLGAAKPPRTPPPEAEFATALYYAGVYLVMGYRHAKPGDCYSEL
jgi:hypothetical protein